MGLKWNPFITGNTCQGKWGGRQKKLEKEKTSDYSVGLILNKIKKDKVGKKGKKVG